MNTLDLIVLILLAVGFVTGLVRRAGEQLIRLVHVIVAAGLALLASSLVLPLIMKLGELPEGRARALAPFLTGFLLIYLFILGVLGLKRAAMRRLGGGRFLGAIVGAVKMAALVAVLLLIPAWLAVREGSAGLREAVEQSRTAEAVREISFTAKGWLFPSEYPALLDEILAGEGGDAP